MPTATVAGAALAVITNIGALFLLANFFPEAPFDGVMGTRAAGRSLWLSIIFAILAVSAPLPGDRIRHTAAVLA